MSQLCWGPLKALCSIVFCGLSVVRGTWEANRCFLRVGTWSGGGLNSVYLGCAWFVNLGFWWVMLISGLLGLVYEMEF